MFAGGPVDFAAAGAPHALPRFPAGRHVFGLPPRGKVKLADMLMSSKCTEHDDSTDYAAWRILHAV